MALNTHAKQLAAMVIGTPLGRVLPAPVASIGAGERAHLLFLSRDPFEATSSQPGPTGPLIGANRLVGV